MVQQTKPGSAGATMSTLLDLEPELILEIVECLPGSSIKNLLLTCRYLNEVCKGTIYRCLESTSRFRMPPVHDLGYVTVNEMSFLVHELCEKPELAGKVRELRLVDWDHGVNIRFFHLLQNLKLLRLEGGRLETLTTWGPVLQRLKVIHIFNDHRLRRVCFQPLLDQASLRELVLVNIHGPQEWELRRGMRRARYLKPRADERRRYLSDRTLEHVIIQGYYLKSIFWNWWALQPFRLKRLESQCPTVRLYFVNTPNPDVSTRMVSRCELAYHRDSIMSISLDHIQFGRSLRHNVLKVLRDLDTVKLLEIDPVVCIGRGHCKTESCSRRQPEPLRFADKLPNGIEGLVILLDLEQSARIQNYRFELVDSVVQARKTKGRFPHLVKIVFIEHPDYASGNRCLDEDPFCCYGSVFGWNDNEMRRQQFKLAYSAAKKVGIRVRFLNEEHFRFTKRGPWFVSD